MSKFRAEAIPLISFNQETEEYMLNQEAVEIVNQIKGPIAVVGVVGLYRTGKSYLLNRVLLDRSDGFGVGPTVNACTKGIWIWGTPLRGQTASGEPCDILVVDSEGIGALDEDATHDVRIFALVLLLCSVFLYNSLGSIDENAIQNLSLVVNLTKHIQLRHSQNTKKNEDDEDEEDEVGCEDYAQFLPSFHWILRDFALQLQDEDGDSITPNEYLSKALAPQKGFTDEIEEKNRVRRLLTTFFVERECFTLVRPLLDETKLQDLAQCPIEDLRAEFYEQVVQFRKRIIQRAKPKMMFGRSLSGMMYMNLISEYVKEINGGGVPNIQNAWIYLCKQENEKAIKEAQRVYQENIKELLLNKLPMEYEELKQSHKMIKEIAMEAFKSKAMGDEAEQFEIELNKKLKESFYDLEENNKGQSKRMCLEFIKRGYYTIEIKLRPELRDIEYEQEKGLQQIQQEQMKQYQSYQEFKRDFQMFLQYLNKFGPKVQNSKEIYLEFLHGKAIEAGQIFNGQLEQELDTIRESNNDQILSYQNELKDMQETYQLEKEKLQNKVQEQELEKKNIIKNQEHIQMMKGKKENEIKELEQKLDQMRVKNKNTEMKILELQQKEMEEVEQTQQMQREQKIKESEWNREKELLIQEKKLLNNEVKMMKEKEKKVEDKYQKNQGVMNQEKRKYQHEMDELSNQVKRERQSLLDKIQTYEEKLKYQEDELNDKTKELTQKDNVYQQKYKEFMKQQQDSTRQIKNLKQQLEVTSMDSKKQQEMKMENQMKSHKELEQSYRKLDLTQKKFKDEYEKEIQILKQKLEQATSQQDEYKGMYEQVKQAFDKSISMIEKEGGNSRIDMKSMVQQQDAFTREKKGFENQLDGLRNKYQQEIEEGNNKIQNLELQQKIDSNKYMKEKERLQELVETQGNKISILQEEVQGYESKIQRGIESNEGRWRQMIMDLEMEIEDLRRDQKDEINVQNNKMEENIKELRTHYETQKEDNEKRYKDEREKQNKKYYQLNEDWEQRMREEEEIREEEMESLRDELRDKEQYMNQCIQQYEQDMALKSQTIDTLEKQLKENKETADKFRGELQQQLSNMQVNLQQENSSMGGKLHSQQIELQKKEKECVLLVDKNENMEKTIRDQEKQLERDKQQYQEEKKILNKKVEEQRKKYQVLNDEYLDKKIAYEKDSALIRQQNQFMSNKIDDLQQQLEVVVNKQDDKMKQYRDELMEDCKDKVNYARQERQQLEDRMEKLKKTTKDHENNNIKKISELEKDNLYKQETLNGLDKKYDELLNKYESEVKKYQQTIQTYQEQYDMEKKPLQIELQKYITMNEKLENDKNDLMQMYEREKILMDGKLQFLQQQKDNAKNELQEQSKKFESTLQCLQLARKNEKSLQDNSLTDMIVQIESKYQNQLEEQKQYYERQLQQQDEKNRKLEKEIRLFKENNLIEKQGSIGNQYINEKRFSELVDNEKKLMKEIEVLKNERENKIMDTQRVLDKERDNYRQRTNEWEQKVKESEMKRSQLIFEQEKERARWNVDKDHLLAQKNEVQDQLEKSERKKEFLMRDNERLKNDQRNNKRMMGQTFLGNSQMGLNLNVQKSQGGGLGGNKNQPMFPNQSSFNNFRKNQMFETNEEDEDKEGRQSKK